MSAHLQGGMSPCCWTSSMRASFFQDQTQPILPWITLSLTCGRLQRPLQQAAVVLLRAGNRKLRPAMVCVSAVGSPW
ncbi:hypothetical protein LNP74_26295 [Klebsiella pneumoniae subsp. pneumoniae]|nr:hypothetical protein [Klebsiella pneumoniae subsp. pneumoniae]